MTERDLRAEAKASLKEMTATRERNIAQVIAVQAAEDSIVQHRAEVDAGLLPADSPPDFVRSDWQQRPDGLPGWFPPEYHPTNEALEEFAKRPDDPKPGDCRVLSLRAAV